MECCRWKVAAVAMSCVLAQSAKDLGLAKAARGSGVWNGFQLRLFGPLAPSISSNMSSLQLAWKLSPLGGLCRTFVRPQNQKGYSLELPSPPFKAKMGCNWASYCSQGAGSYPLTYALELTHSEFQDPTQFYLIYLFKRHDQAEDDGACA